MLHPRTNIETLYNTYSRKLYFISLRITTDPMDAEEAMHDTFLKYDRLWNKGRIEKIEHWLTRTCVRLSIDRLRKKKREAIFKDMLTADSLQEAAFCDDTSLTEEAAFDLTAIKQNILLLPDGFRLILSLHLLEGYDYDEIAEITQLKPSSVRSQYLRAKKRLFQILTQPSSQNDEHNR